LFVGGFAGLICSAREAIGLHLYRTRDSSQHRTMQTPTRSTVTWSPGAAVPAPAARARPLARNTPVQAIATAELLLGDNVARSVEVTQRGADLEVVEGMVMVTCGDGEDHVVRAGETFRSALAGRHVILSLRPSRVRIAARAA
jgi:hypothetical protein